MLIRSILKLSNIGIGINITVGLHKKRLTSLSGCQCLKEAAAEKMLLSLIIGVSLGFTNFLVSGKFFTENSKFANNLGKAFIKGRQLFYTMNSCIFQFVI